ncbi:MAG: alpha/beta hydrolase-fold protein [Chloroflexi bacterium]|nr:alpha/beta hydrolase-fold protein [Chloroflexota bacterium]
MAESRIVADEFESNALTGNRLGDPAIRTTWIYLPPGYDDSTERYPAVYLLAGYTGTGRTFLNQRPWEEDIQQRMDRLIEAGQCRPMVLVMPDCFTRYGGSQYIDSDGTGHYQQYLLEVVHRVDGHFRTRASRAYRGIAGGSSGGFGALTAAMDHPEVFGLVADHSGDKGFDKVYSEDLRRLPDTLAAIDVGAALANPYAFAPKGEPFLQLMAAAAMAAAYSPNHADPLGFDWPIDPHTGELRRRVWRRWLAHDPIQRLTDRAESLRSLRLLYMDCGNHDEYSIHLGCRVMARELTRLGIRHRYEEFDGGHRGTQHRYDVSFAALSAAMPAEQAPRTVRP